MQDEKLKGFLQQAQMKAKEAGTEFMTNQGLVFPIPEIPFEQLARTLDPITMVGLLAIAAKFGKDQNGMPIMRLRDNPGLQTLYMVKLGAAILAKSTGG